MAGIPTLWNCYVFEGMVRLLFNQDMGLMAQGYQRDLDAAQKVVPLLAPNTKLLVIWNWAVFIIWTFLSEEICNCSDWLHSAYPLDIDSFRTNSL